MYQESSVHWIAKFCLEHEFAVIPNGSDEPYVSLASAAHIMQYKPDTLRRKLRELQIVEHPHFSGFIRLSDLSRD